MVPGEAFAVVEGIAARRKCVSVRWAPRRFSAAHLRVSSKSPFLSRASTVVATNSRPKNRSLANARLRHEPVVALR